MMGREGPMKRLTMVYHEPQNPTTTMTHGVLVVLDKDESWVQDGRTMIASCVY